MQEEKKEISNFKRVWQNKRYKAMIKLAGYILFFILIGVVIDFNGADSSYTDKVTPKKVSFKSYNNYNFYYNITYLGLVDEPVNYISIDGSRYGQNQIFTIRNTDEKYFLESHKLYQIKEQLEEITSPFFLSFDKLSPSRLSAYIEKGKLESKTEYADQTVKKEYSLSVEDFAKMYQDEKVEIEGIVRIITYEQDNVVHKIELDLTAYNKMKFEFNYKEIGKVKPFYKEDFLLSN